MPAASRSWDPHLGLHLHLVRIVGRASIEQRSGPAPRPPTRCPVGTASDCSDRRSGNDRDPHPVQPDLDRTATYYGALGLKVIERHDPFLVMRTGSAELHFAGGHIAPVPGQAFLDVPDAGKLWKELQGLGVVDAGPLEDRPSGVREFVVTDPDGNRIHVGSRTSES